MGERENRMVREFRERLPAQIRPHVRKLIVYGSRARDDGDDDSDLDLVAIVDEKTPELENALDDAAYDVMWEFDFRPVISLKVFSQDSFQAAADKGFSFYKHVLEEGVAV